MGAEKKFCMQCGQPLTPGVVFCEDCGTPVSPAGGSAPPVAPPLPGTSPGVPGNATVAVLPFAYRQRGMFSTDKCTLVIYPDRVIIASVPKSREKELDQSTMEIQAALMEKHLEGKKFWELAAGVGVALFRIGWSAPDYYTADAAREKEMLRTINIPTRYWERYAPMAPDAVLADDPRNTAVPLESIGFVRGESDLSTNTDQILIGTASGLVKLFFDFGVFSFARRALFSFLLPGTGETEQVLGVIPSAGEAEVEGFGFQYSWTVVVTGKRVCFCMIEDDFADEMTTWLEMQEKQAKATGRPWREGEEAGNRDAPWQMFRDKPVPELLENEVNFFIPLSRIGSVEITAGGPGEADTVCLTLPGGPYCLVFPGGTSGHARQVLRKVLAVRDA
jgi:hypothetical protein